MKEATFKTRSNNNTHSFGEETKRNSTALKALILIQTKWKILKICTTYKPGNRTCNLCVTDKIHIIQNIGDSCNINKRKDTLVKVIKKYIIQYNTVKQNFKGLAVLFWFRDSFGLKKAKIMKKKNSGLYIYLSVYPIDSV